MSSRLKNTGSVAGLMVLIASVCAAEVSESRLDQISLGMKTYQILSVLGEPEYIRNEGPGAEGKPIETIVYNVTKRIDLSKEDNDTGQREMIVPCALIMVDGTLVRIDRQR